jgi:hypothetical protein
MFLSRRLEPGRVGPIIEVRSSVGLSRAPQQVLSFRTDRKPRRFVASIFRESRETLLERFGLLKPFVHHAAPCLRKAGRRSHLDTCHEPRGDAETVRRLQTQRYKKGSDLQTWRYSISAANVGSTHVALAF